MASFPDITAWANAPSLTAATLPATRADLKVLIVGAGPAGIAAARALKQAQIPFSGMERAPAVGGLWDNTNPWSPAYDNLVTNSSVATTHLGMPVPCTGEKYLARPRALAYLKTLAADSGVPDHFEFHCEVREAHKQADGAWRVRFFNHRTHTESSRDYRAVILACGHQSADSAKYPEALWAQAQAHLPEVLHSAHYRSPEPFAGKKVLIVGMGNSGSEIATELARHAQRTLIAARTPPWIAPLYVLGKPSDEFVVSGKELPPWLEIPFYRCLQWWYVGRKLPRNYPRPLYQILDRLPISDRGIVALLRSGAVQLKRNVVGFSAGSAQFERDTPEAIDAVIFATGYRRQIPFLAEGYSPFGKEKFIPSLLLFHPRERGLIFMPEVIVTQGAWPMYAEQAQTVAAYLAAEARNTPRVCRFDTLRLQTNPEMKGHLFKLADEYHVHPKRYSERLAEFRQWITD